MIAGMTHTTTLYGIVNCDTVKKARAWLTAHGVSHQFHDFKKQGLPPDLLDDWLATVEWEKLLNRNGMMWRKLSPEAQAAVTGRDSARRLMLEVPTIVKRPVVRWPEGQITVAFDPIAWAARIT